MLISKVVIRLSLLFSISACGSKDTVDLNDVNPDTIYQRYIVDFDNETKKLYVSAQFRVGGATGTTVRLNSSESVEINGQSMAIYDGDVLRPNLTGTFYSLSTPIEAPKDLNEFRWKSKDGKIITNVLPSAKSVAISQPSSGSVINRKNPVSVSFMGEDLSSNEQVHFYLRTSEDPASDQRNSAICSISSGKTCFFSAEDISKLPKGVAKLSIKRLKWLPTSESSGKIVGTMSSEFLSEDVEVFISE
jgi:hypothetical protein